MQVLEKQGRTKNLELLKWFLSSHSVDEESPANQMIWKSFELSELVQDFVHQQYYPKLPKP